MLFQSSRKLQDMPRFQVCQIAGDYQHAIGLRIARHVPRLHERSKPQIEQLEVTMLARRLVISAGVVGAHGGEGHLSFGIAGFAGFG